MKILGALLELPAKQHCQSSPFTSKLGQIGSLAGSSKRAPRILIFSIAMGAEYLSYVKFIATWAPTFFGYIISVLASVAGIHTMNRYPGSSMIVHVLGQVFNKQTHFVMMKILLQIYV